MNNIFNEDFTDFIQQLNQFNVKYVLVGGYSVIFHGYNRTTGDMDIFVENTTENYLKLKRAFGAFGLPIEEISESDFVNCDNFDVFTFGRPPVAIDIMTKLANFNFNEVYNSAIWMTDNDLEVLVIHYNHLIEAKKIANRFKDLDDIEVLQKNRDLDTNNGN